MLLHRNKLNVVFSHVMIIVVLKQYKCFVITANCELLISTFDFIAILYCSWYQVSKKTNLQYNNLCKM